MKLHIGIDLGTSACRVIAIDAQSQIHAQIAVVMPAPERVDAGVTQSAEVWWQTTQGALADLFRRISPQSVISIAVDGTSGTLLLADRNGLPLTPALMYNDARTLAEAERITRFAPIASAAHGTSGALAKLLYLQEYSDEDARHALSQADFVSARLSGRFGISDENNCLKLGFDPVERCWPEWMVTLGVHMHLLPRAVPPGTVIGNIDPAIAAEFSLSSDTRIVAGTTDSTAAFLASRARLPGEAVTSLGSTLVMKVISGRPVFAPEYGIYSHRIGDVWLAGGGSNSGGNVLRRLFSAQQISDMTPLLRPDQPTGLDYYPLLQPGERFPVNDPHLPPRLTPRPVDDLLFFQGLLESMARIEQRAYALLASFGAPYPVAVYSAGGGAANTGWTQIRGQMLNTSMRQSAQTEAAYGTALLARRGIIGHA